MVPDLCHERLAKLSRPGRKLYNAALSCVLLAHSEKQVYPKAPSLDNTNENAYHLIA